jgi:hypothetical protein
MSNETSSALPETVTQEAAEFLRTHEAEDAFRTVCALARECYPDLVRLDADLIDDPDEEDRQYVLLLVTLPKGYPVARALEHQRHFHERLVLDVPPSALLLVSDRTAWAEG